MVTQEDTSFGKILALLRQNDPAALGLLFERYGRRLVGYAHSRWHFDENAAWEIIYQTFDVLILKADTLSFAAQNQLDSFVFSVFTNKLHEAHRQRQRDKERYVPMTALEPIANDDDENPNEAEPPDEQALLRDWPETLGLDDGPDSIRVSRMNQALATLPPTDRDLLLLWAQGYTYPEIAAMLDIDPKHLKVRCFRAKQKIINWYNTNA